MHFVVKHCLGPGKVRNLKIAGDRCDLVHFLFFRVDCQLHGFLSLLAEKSSSICPNVVGLLFVFKCTPSCSSYCHTALVTSCSRRYRLPRGRQRHGRAEEEQEEAAGLPRQLRRAGHIQRAAGGPRAGVSAVQQLELVQKAISNIYIWKVLSLSPAHHTLRGNKVRNWDFISHFIHIHKVKY